MKTLRRSFFVSFALLLLGAVSAGAVDILQALGLKKKPKKAASPKPWGQSTTTGGSNGSGYNGTSPKSGYSTARPSNGFSGTQGTGGYR